MEKFLAIPLKKEFVASGDLERSVSLYGTGHGPWVVARTFWHLLTFCDILWRSNALEKIRTCQTPNLRTGWQPSQRERREHRFPDGFLDVFFIASIVVLWYTELWLCVIICETSCGSAWLIEGKWVTPLCCHNDSVQRQATELCAVLLISLYWSLLRKKVLLRSTNPALQGRHARPHEGQRAEEGEAAPAWPLLFQRKLSVFHCLDIAECIAECESSERT